MASTATYEAMSASEHSAQLRKAVIASTIGTTIEWYDFFIYGTAAGLIFGKLYFPNEDPLTATLAAFGTYFIGFVGRPIGAAIFGHYGDRIGRKATLDRHAFVHGHRDLSDRLCSHLPVDRYLGRRDPDRSAHGPGHRRRWGVGRIGIAGNGMVASPSPARPRRILAAIRRALRSVPREPFDSGVQRVVGGSVRRLGLADTVCPLHPARRGRPVDPARHPRDADLPGAGRQQQDREDPASRGHQKATKGDHSFGLAADGRAGAVLHLYRLHLCLRRRHPAYVAQHDPDGGAWSRLASRSSPFRCRGTSPTASAARRCT